MFYIINIKFNKIKQVFIINIYTFYQIRSVRQFISNSKQKNISIVYQIKEKYFNPIFIFMFLYIKKKIGFFFNKHIFERFKDNYLSYILQFRFYF